jgi:hypothetical protein
LSSAAKPTALMTVDMTCVEREAIDESTGYKRSSRDTYLQRMAAKRLVESIGRGAVRASAMLFG